MFRRSNQHSGSNHRNRDLIPSVLLMVLSEAQATLQNLKTRHLIFLLAWIDEIAVALSPFEVWRLVVYSDKANVLPDKKARVLRQAHTCSQTRCAVFWDKFLPDY